jgi:NSS family neurotransmitter:Na+ symporter
MVIFSIVFSNGLEAGSGPGLLFQTLPVAFGQMTGGWFFGTLFFGLVVIAAFSSAISLIEPAISWVIDRWKMTRTGASWLVGFLTWLVGVGTVLSFSDWSEVYFLTDKNFFDTLDYITTNIMLPLGGLFIAVFFGWILTKEQIKNELNLQASSLGLFLNTLKYITPIAVSIVFVSNLI